MTKMFDSIVCFRSVPGLKKSPVLGSPRLVASTIVLSALFSGVAVHQVHAQNDAPIFSWGGRVGQCKCPKSTLNDHGGKQPPLRNKAQ